MIVAPSPLATAPAAPRLHRPRRGLAIWWIVAGALGGIVAFLLYLEYIGQLTAGRRSSAAASARS